MGFPALPSSCDNALTGTIGKSTSRQVFARLESEKSGTKTWIGLPKYAGPTLPLFFFAEPFFVQGNGSFVSESSSIPGNVCCSALSLGSFMLKSFRRELYEGNYCFQ